jgi:tetratricopeptide (TPR) repeat protein
LSPRTRIVAVVAAAALAAVGVTLGATVLSSDGADDGSTAGDVRSGNPPLVLDLGVRRDPEAAALRRGQRLYAQGEEAQERGQARLARRRFAAAAREFAPHSSPQAEIARAFAAWPKGSLARVERLGRRLPRSGVVQLHVGLARFWTGRTEAAFSAWRTAVRADPDTASAVRAADLLHPDTMQGLPPFVPGFSVPRRYQTLSPSKQLRELARAARGNGVRAKLLYGLALQRLQRPLSAERQYAAAAAVAPENVEAQVAAAVGRYSKDAPERAFSRLGPLTRKFPRAATVRFHLGLLLLWLGRVDEGKRQLELARRLEPASKHAEESSRLLARLEATVEG